MLKIAKLLGLGKQGANNGGLLNLVSDKVGKISFKRSLPILIITAVVVPLLATEGLTWPVVAVIAIAAGTYVLPKMFEK